MSTPSSLRIRRRPALVALLLAVAPILPATTAGAAVPPGTPVLHHSAELVSEPLGPYTRQGSDVALSADGSTLAVAGTGAYDTRSTVVIFVRSGDRWARQTTLSSPPNPVETYTDLWASEIAISADGDTLAVTDPTRLVEVDGTQASGIVFLYTRTGRTWRATGQVLAPQSAARFGLDLSLSANGTSALMGSSGRAYVADTRSRVVRELPRPAGANSFGQSVAISPDGRTAAVSTERRSIGFPGVDGVFVFVDDPVRGWIQRWHLEEQPEHSGSYFGAAVAVTDAQTVVVGAPYQHRGVSVFDRRGTALVRTARFAPQYDTQAERLGSSVAVSADGSTVVAGAPYRDAAGGSVLSAGAGYRWVRSPSGWAWAGLLSVARPNTNEHQGRSVTMSGDGRVVVLSAPGRASARLGETGAAIVFSAVSQPGTP